jgi:hypothetical protein
MAQTLFCLAVVALTGMEAKEAAFSSDIGFWWS